MFENREENLWSKNAYYGDIEVSIVQPAICNECPEQSSLIQGLGALHASAKTVKEL